MRYHFEDGGGTKHFKFLCLSRPVGCEFKKKKFIVFFFPIYPYESHIFIVTFRFFENLGVMGMQLQSCCEQRRNFLFTCLIQGKVKIQNCGPERQINPKTEADNPKSKGRADKIRSSSLLEWNNARNLNKGTQRQLTERVQVGCYILRLADAEWETRWARGRKTERMKGWLKRAERVTGGDATSRCHMWSASI